MDNKIDVQDAFIKAMAKTNAADEKRQESIKKQAHEAFLYRQKKAEEERKERERIANRTPEEIEADRQASRKRLREIIYGTEDK